jgi:hypothetical protein
MSINDLADRGITKAPRHFRKAWLLREPMSLLPTNATPETIFDRLPRIAGLPYSACPHRPRPPPPRPSDRTRQVTNGGAVHLHTERTSSSSHPHRERHLRRPPRFYYSCFFAPMRDRGRRSRETHRRPTSNEGNQLRVFKLEHFRRPQKGRDEAPQQWGRFTKEPSSVPRVGSGVRLFVWLCPSFHPGRPSSSPRKSLCNKAPGSLIE